MIKKSKGAALVEIDQGGYLSFGGDKNEPINY